jgi:penicillin-binding protein 1A
VRIGNRRQRAWWWRGLLVLTLWAAVVAPVVAAVSAIVTLRRWARALPAVPDLAEWRRQAPATSTIVAADGTVLAELPFSQGVEVGHRTWVALEDIPRGLIEAVLAAEDVHFFAHHGVDYPAIVRAAWANYRAGRIIEGASTIAQQLARNLLPEEIGKERVLRRKVREALMARQLERRWDKAAILEVYLNFVFLGGNAYGVAAAARLTFDLELKDLSAGQAALLAGLIQAPSRLEPSRHPEAARLRRDEILERMKRAGFLDEPSWRRARAEPVQVRPPPSRYGNVLPWYTEAARRLVTEAMPEEAARGGLRIETAALPAVGIALDHAADAQRQRWPAGSRADRSPSAGDGARELPEAAALWWDVHTGYVEALHGGSQWQTSQFDRALQACRQPGSAWKLLLYGAALEAAAITPGTPLLDAPVTEYDEVQNVFWKPQSGDRFRGVVLAEDAFAASLNAPAIDVLGRVGGEAVIAWARRLGITSPLANVGPLALGASCVHLVELAHAYAVVIRNGWELAPRLVVRVRRGEQVLFDASVPEDPWLAADQRIDRLAALAGLPPDERVGASSRGALLDERIAYQLQHMLRAVVERGTSTAARGVGRQVAGKTGTTNDNTDAWFVGYSARMLGVVWMGFDDPRLTLGSKGDGAHAALPWWMDGMRLVEGARPAQPVLGAPPPGMEAVRIDRESGLRAVTGGLELWFRAGSAPVEEAGRPSPVNPDLGRTTREF